MRRCCAGRSRAPVRVSARCGRRGGALSPVRFTGDKWVYLGGAIAVLVSLAGRVLVGGLYGDAEALRLIEALENSSLYFGAAVATSSATILALMLTLLGLTRNAEREFDRWVYQSISRISVISTASLCGAILLLLLLSLPVGDFEKLPDAWFPVLYYLLIVLIALLSGLFISAVLMLYTAIHHVVQAFRPGAENSG